MRNRRICQTSDGRRPHDRDPLSQRGRQHSRRLRQLRTVLKDQPFVAEIVVIDDLSEIGPSPLQATLQTAGAQTAGSRSSSAVAPARLRRRCSLRSCSRCRPIIFVSADGVDPISLIPVMYEKTEDGFALAQCSRYLKPATLRPYRSSTGSFNPYFGLEYASRSVRKSSIRPTHCKMFQRRDMLGAWLTQNRLKISPQLEVFA